MYLVRRASSFEDKVVAAGERRGKGGGSKCLEDSVHCIWSGDGAGWQSPGSGADSISSKTGEAGVRPAWSHSPG